MYIIGELINGMYAKIGRAILEKDKAAIQKCALDQVNAGAAALDVNCGPASKQPVADIQWLVESIQEVTDKKLCIDSSKPDVLEAGLKAAKGKVIINSTTADQEKMKVIVPLARKYGAKLIGLTISSKGIPQNKDQRLELAASIVSFCMENEFPLGDLFLDPIAMPVNVAQSQQVDILESIRDFKVISEPPVKTVIGLSNVSQGAFNRSLINRTFLVMALSYGLDAAILDPLDKELVHSAAAGDIILNKNIYCDKFLEAHNKT